MDLAVVLYVVWIASVVHGPHLVAGQTLTQADTLYSTLLTGYNKFLRPVNDQSQAVQVCLF
jgi:hypothetical protein